MPPAPPRRGRGSRWRHGVPEWETATGRGSGGGRPASARRGGAADGGRPPPQATSATRWVALDEAIAVSQSALRISPEPAPGSITTLM